MKIAKHFRWEMGHRLPEHDGECRNVHGHSYKMTVQVEGEPDFDTGMVIDFNDISAAVKPLLQELDHAFLCQDCDEDLLALLCDMEMKHVVIPYPSTVENLCQMFADRLEPMFATYDNLRAFTILIYETESSVAELRVRLN